MIITSFLVWDLVAIFSLLVELFHLCYHELHVLKRFFCCLLSLFPTFLLVILPIYRFKLFRFRHLNNLNPQSFCQIRQAWDCEHSFPVIQLLFWLLLGMVHSNLRVIDKKSLRFLCKCWDWSDSIHIFQNLNHRRKLLRWSNWWYLIISKEQSE